MLELFEHNQKAYQAAVRMMEKYGKAAIVHPTGTGKSYIAFHLIEEHAEEVIFWLSPSEYIFRTQLENLKKQAPDLPLQNVHFYTYAKLMCCAPEELAAIAALSPAYIILDEFHRVGAECWGASTMGLLKYCPNAKMLGLSATNVRYLDNQRDMAQELFDGHVASEMTLGEAIVRGILPTPKYVTTVYQAQKALEQYQARVDRLQPESIRETNQKYLEELRRTLEQAEGLDRVFEHHITDRQGKYLVFCASREHMDEMMSHVQEWFSGVNPEQNVYKAYSDDPSTMREFEAFKADQSGALKLLFCIDMLNEGVHIAGVSGVILFRPTISPIVYKQQIGRALTTGKNTIPLILDIVNNFEGLNSIAGLQNEMDQAVHRLYVNGEREKVVAERFEVVEQVHDSRKLFEQLEKSLDSTWEHYFLAAKAYYNEHGELTVPIRYTTKEGLNLGSWLQVQRLVRRGKRNGSLSERQIEQLDQIGMIWDDRVDLAWKRGLSRAASYYKKNGNLNVPFPYKDSDGFALGQWVGVKRREYQNGDLTEEQIRQLEGIGMTWDAVSAKWERGYAEAAAYYAEHQNLDVPQKYVTESGLKLGNWVAYQRQSYQEKSLSMEQIRRMEQIGMRWEGRNNSRWMECYRDAAKYFREHGDLNVPPDYVTDEGKTLGKWLARMRYAYQKPKGSGSGLTQERILLLEQIGMKWDTVRTGKLRKAEEASGLVRTGGLKSA